MSISEVGGSNSINRPMPSQPSEQANRSEQISQEPQVTQGPPEGTQSNQEVHIPPTLSQTDTFEVAQNRDDIAGLTQTGGIEEQQGVSPGSNIENWIEEHVPPGTTVTLSADVNGSLSLEDIGIQVGAGGEIEVSRDFDGNITIALEGEVRGGVEVGLPQVYAEGHLDDRGAMAGLNVAGDVGAGASARFEFTFEPSELQEVGSLLHQAGVRTIEGDFNGALNEAEQAYNDFTDNLSAIEMNANVYASGVAGAGDVNVRLDENNQPFLENTHATVEANLEGPPSQLIPSHIRVEFDRENNIGRVEIGHSVSGEGNLTLDDPSRTAGIFSGGLEVSGTVNPLVLEFDTSNGMDINNLLRNPQQWMENHDLHAGQTSAEFEGNLTIGNDRYGIQLHGEQELIEVTPPRIHLNVSNEDGAPSISPSIELPHIRVPLEIDLGFSITRGTTHQVGGGLGVGVASASAEAETTIDSTAFNFRLNGSLREGYRLNAHTPWGNIDLHLGFDR